MAWTLTAGLAAVVILTFGSALWDGPAQFLAGRLNDPVGYRNATAALMAMAFWPLLCLAAQRAPNPLLRAAAFSAATTALGLAYPDPVARRADRLRAAARSSRSRSGPTASGARG